MTTVTSPQPPGHGPRHRADHNPTPPGHRVPPQRPAPEAEHAWWVPSPEEARLREEERWEAESRRLRGEVATRLERFSGNHAEHAWQHRNSFRLASTAVALLYLDVDDGQQWTVRVAGKVFADSDRVAEPMLVLRDMAAAVRDVVASGGDPRLELCERPEEMSAHATYYGVAVSLLDTPAGLWREVQQRVSGGGLWVPSRVLAILTDQTLIHADRYDDKAPHSYVVQANKPLGVQWGFLGFAPRWSWKHDPDLVRLRDDATRPLWIALYELHSVLLRTARHD
jgi:hypothetical protein